MTLALQIAVVLLVLLAGLLGLIGILYLTRGNPVARMRVLGEEDDAPDVSSPHFCLQVQTHVNTDLIDGNSVEVLFNGEEVYPRLWRDLRGAQDLITWHVFWFKPGALSDELKEILKERARNGVTVLMLYDHFGALGVPRAYWDELRAAGVEVHAFRPFRWHDMYKWQQRTHMRTVVVDGKVGYTGGFSIEDRWRGDGRHEDQWRDTSVRVRGPAVHQLQGAFAADWAEATGDLLLGRRVFHPECLEEEGPVTAGLVYGSPSVGSTDIERFFALSISGARRRLWITNAYFVPDDDFRGMLVEAVRRGVDVRVLTPGGNTDKPSTWYAGRTHYETLLEGGVRIYEYGPTMVHAKTLVADGIWSAVGTTNFDNRSMSLNDEVVLMVHSEEVARTLEERFEYDLELADELDLEAFRARGAWERAKEGFWVLFSRFL